MLADAREAAGLTVHDVAEQTKIRATIIAAMESDDFSACGGHVYARGQLRSIAQVLGIDPLPVIDRYDAQA